MGKIISLHDPEPKKVKDDKLTIFVGVDDVLCMSADSNYGEAVPLIDNIVKINALFDAGHKIIIWTSRGSLDQMNYWNLTKKQLDEWGVKYTDVGVGKPHYDVMFCSRAHSTVNDTVLHLIKTGKLPCKQ